MLDSKELVHLRSVCAVFVVRHRCNKRLQHLQTFLSKSKSNMFNSDAYDISVDLAQSHERKSFF